MHTKPPNFRSSLFISYTAGGSGSGKTTLAQAIYTALGREDNVTFISHDSYYKDLSSWTMAQREKQVRALESSREVTL